MLGTDPSRVAERAARLKALGPRPPWWHMFARREWEKQHAAIMAMDVSEFGSLLRQYYGPDDVMRMAMKRHPMLDQLRKR